MVGVSSMGTALLAIDQGTTGTTTLVMDARGTTLGRATVELPQHYPQPGWVEHDADEIRESVVESIGRGLAEARIRGEDIAAIGIANQRETVLLWERHSGRPVGRAVVWQDRRTAGRCEELIQAGHSAEVRRVTGLVIDPYFSATKVRWLLDSDPPLRQRANSGELAFGTVDSFLVHRLAGGAPAAAPHVTDATNASRTLLMDLRRREWDDAMCRLFGVPKAVLPRIVASAGVVAKTRNVPALPDGIPIAGLAGDQHAALFGQACFEPGQAKCTYGTGAFVLVNTGDAPMYSRSGLLSTVAWQIGDRVTFALEGSCFVAGAAVQWLRDGLGIVKNAGEIEQLARRVPDSDGVVFVPALAGLGAPHWDPEARGLVAGLTRRSSAAHLARATLEAIAFQVNDLLAAMKGDLGAPISRLRVDGGAAANDLLLELQSDLSAVSVERPEELETTARGAAMLAGVGAGFFAGGADAARMISIDRTFMPRMGDDERRTHHLRWSDAVERARTRSQNQRGLR